MNNHERIYDKIRALLAKAESTEYPDEAAIYTAKAQELIATHAIDMALLQEHDGKGQVVTRILNIARPYPKEKYLLLSGVARANNCRAILGVDLDEAMQRIEEGSLDSSKGKLATVIGYESDLDAVELLFASLLVQAVNEMFGYGVQINEWGENRTKSFRRSFLYQFAWRVGDRLAEAAESVRDEAAESHGPALLPVLASRADAVDEALKERFPNTSTLRTSVTNRHGVAAGDAAGKRADIGSTRLRGSEKAIPSHSQR